MNGDPYNFGTHPLHYGRYDPEDTVRFTHQPSFDRTLPVPVDNNWIPPRLLAWAQSNLPDGEYVIRYQIGTDSFAIMKVDGSGCPVLTHPVAWWPT